MDEINKYLERTGLLPIKDAGLTIISLYGVSENKATSSSSNTVLKLANRIAGNNVFTSANKPLQADTIEIANGLQLYVDLKSKTVYLFMDSNIETTSLARTESFTASMMEHQSKTMKGLLFMLLVSHLVIPILPPSLLPAEFLSTLVALGQIKANMYTHLVGYQAACWKYWDISVPSVFFEKKEFERVNPSLLGWWGPAKGVPLIVFVANNIPFSNIVPITIKKMQDFLQRKLRTTLQAFQLIPVKAEGNTSHSPVEVRSLFVLPSGSQSFIHIVPDAPKNMDKPEIDEYTFDQPISLSSYLQMANVEESPEISLYHDYENKLLRNFVLNWAKAATSRNPLHSNYSNSRKVDVPKSVPLPNAMQFISSIVPLLGFIFNKPVTENGVDFKKNITSEYPSTKGMIQQIDVILRKKIKDNIEIERVFSKSHSMDILQKGVDTYLQDSPSYYTEQYHKWKLHNVMRMYRTLARGPCMEECAIKLERECESIWKNERQSCEQISLTGKPCRLKLNHEHEATPQRQARDERSVFIDSTKHSSGINFFHACNCGKSQRVREDPFEIEDANVRFYSRFMCCLGQGRAALDIRQSMFGEKQDLVLNYDEIPADDCAMIYMGPSSAYKNNVGLDKVDGFMASTNFLIPWSITTMDEIRLRRQQQQTTFEIEKPTNNENADHDTVEWPALGKVPTVVKPTTAPAAPIASLEAFPALGTNPVPTTTIVTSNSTSNSNNQKQLFDNWKRRRHRSRERVQGLVRGYVGAEYECPNGHRFFSCGEGRVCKLGHVGHPKEHGNYFVHQDLPIYIMCPCSYANSTSISGSNTTNNNQLETTAQLLRLYVVTPENAITISIEPKIKIYVPGNEEAISIDLGITDSIALGPTSMYVLRLPFIFRDHNELPIPVEVDTQKRLKSAFLQKDCIKFHYQESKKWEA